jgi:hypothetical protein
MSDILVIAEDTVASRKLSELVQADHRFGLDPTYQIFCQVVSAELLEQIASEERFVVIYSADYARQVGVETARALAFTENGHHVCCLVPKCVKDQSLIFKVNEQSLLCRAGILTWAVRQHRADKAIPLDSLYDRHRGLF